MLIRTKLSHLLLMISLVALSAFVMLFFLLLLLGFTTVRFDLPFGFAGLALLALLASLEAGFLSMMLDFGKGSSIKMRARRLIRVELRIGGVLLVVVTGLILGGYGEGFFEWEQKHLEGHPMVSEMNAIQAAMNALMADQRISAVVSTKISQNGLATFPEHTRPDGRTGHKLDAYFTKRHSEFYYCWNEVGEITRLDQIPQPNCPEKYLAPEIPPEPTEWLQGLYGVLIVTGVVVLIGLSMNLPDRFRSRGKIQKYYECDA